MSLLVVVAFSLSTSLTPWFLQWSSHRTQSGNVMQVALGDGRKLFAKHVYAKADAYFHNGYYPTIYDRKDGFETAHIAADPSHQDEKEEDKSFLGEPRDWLDRFSRNFFPSRHTHLGEAECDHHDCQHEKEGHVHDEHCEHEPTEANGAEREILPWLRLSAELDPQRVETYVVSAYWLRSSLKKVDEAEQFLREGLRANPGDYEILYELGAIYNEERQDASRARNVWELGLKNWRARQAAGPEPNLLVGARLLGQLATLEVKQTNYPRAVEHLLALKTISPNKPSIQKWIEDVQAKQTPAPAP